MRLFARRARHVVSCSASAAWRGWLGAALVSVAAPASQAAEPVSSDVWLVGSGTPLVLFESGLGSGGAMWDSLAARVAAFSATFRYSRPGYDRGPVPASDADGMRTSDEAVAMLRATLASNHVAPPYVLVGHSLGGLYLLRYASLYPGDVAGIVLVDARLPGFTARCIAAGGCAQSEPLPENTPAYILAERDGLAASEASAPTPEALGRIPVTVISRGRGPMLSIWQDVQRNFASRLANGRFVLAEQSGHSIHVDQPDLLLDEIRAMVERVRRH